jgi:uncharacterized protein (TIGR03382 family)
MVLPRLTLAGVVLLAACDGAPPRPPHVESRRDELRPTDTSSSEMWRYQASDAVEHYDEPDSGFRVHFTRAGPNAVPADDTNTNTVPDLAEAVASVYDLVATKYQTQMGFRAPVGDVSLGSNGGNERFDVYLLNFAPGADAAFRTDQCTNEKCVGYVVQENDFVGFGYPNATVATRILGSHEYFHAIQDAYDNGQDVVITEGTAVWATEQFDPSTSDLEGFANGFLSRPERSLDSPPPGPVPSYAYGSAVFFEFLSEKYGQPIIRKLWERLENGQGAASEPGDVANPHWIIQLDALLQSDYQSSFAAMYREYIRWNFYTGMSTDPLKAYANGGAYPQPMMTSVTAPQQIMVLRVFYASAQYFKLPADARTQMGALLVDDPNSPEDETKDMALIVSARRNSKNDSLITVADVKAGTELVDTTGGAQLVVAVINTVRGPEAAGVLSRRPGVCIGSPAELADCRLALNPSFDAGVPDAGQPDAGPVVVDAGVDAGIDAGTIGGTDAGTDGGTTTPDPPRGCGCSSGGSALAGFALLIVLSRKPRRK